MKSASSDATTAPFHKILNGWGLFWLMSSGLPVFMVIEMTRVDLSTAKGVSEMIGYSVHWAVPFKLQPGVRDATKRHKGSHRNPARS